jgi:hypothetical protein
MTQSGLSINGFSVPADRLKSILNNIYATRAHKLLLFRAYGGATYGQVTATIAAAKPDDFDGFVLLTDRTEAEFERNIARDDCSIVFRH